MEVCDDEAQVGAIPENLATLLKAGEVLQSRLLCVPDRSPSGCAGVPLGYMCWPVCPLALPSLKWDHRCSTTSATSSGTSSRQGDSAWFLS